MGISSLSIVCCTRDRPAELGRLIDSLCHARRLPVVLELLVIDDGNLPAETQATLAAKVRESGVDWVYINKARQAGLLRSRILAADIARHDWLLFFDDDVEIEPDYIERFCEIAGQAPDLAGI